MKSLKRATCIFLIPAVPERCSHNCSGFCAVSTLASRCRERYSSVQLALVCTALAVLGSVLFAAAGNAAEEKKSSPPPLIIDMSAPLLLDEPEKPADEPVHKADNSACYVCHANYEEEELVGWHAVEDTGCVDCHGDSFAHRNDENNTTPPDVMFPKSKIEANCAECHEDHDVPAHKVIARFLERGLSKSDPKSLICTDCHGHHRLELRTVVWNKETGELITGKQQAKKAEPGEPKTAE